MTPKKQTERQSLRFVIPGGSGQVGQVLARGLRAKGHTVTLIGRNPAEGTSSLAWDGQSLGPWAQSFENADVIINLAGRTVDCRYTETNLQQMMDSRVDSTRVVGEAIANATQPPRVWLQMSTATIYAHRFDQGNDEATGIIGGDEPDVPAYWSRSVAIAKAREQALHEADTPHTRKVALRTAMVMSPDKGGILDVLRGLVRKRIGGTIAGGQQYVSRIHGNDFVRAVEFIVDRETLSGSINICAPNPLPQKEFMAALRQAVGVKLGLPATKWMAKIGAVFLRTDTELLLKSRRVIPGRLLESGFQFMHPSWPEAAADLCK
ncbi:MAG: DUF1731 domain-containing protein [Kofleriaceae bacterium]|nr:DUF1731 domain-containing protein [Kofleriaceae bacterium]